MIDDNEPELNPQGKAEVQKNKDAKDYELIPTKSLGQFVFRTKLKDYLSEPLPEIIEDDGILGFIFLQPKVIVYNVEFYYVGAVKCN